jgi:hypothetical protein
MEGYVARFIVHTVKKSYTSKVEGLKNTLKGCHVHTLER